MFMKTQLIFLNNNTADLSFDCRLFYPTEMVLIQHGSTLLN